MKIASNISRYLLGFLFTVFGANGFLHFLQPPPPSTAFGAQFMTVVVESHFMAVIVLLELIAGMALLAGRFVPLALIVMAAIITNILNYHLTMDPGGIAPGLVATVLWVVTAIRYRESFRAIVEAHPDEAATNLRRQPSTANS